MVFLYGLYGLSHQLVRASRRAKNKLDGQMDELRLEDDADDEFAVRADAAGGLRKLASRGDGAAGTQESASTAVAAGSGSASAQRMGVAMAALNALNTEADEQQSFPFAQVLSAVRARDGGFPEDDLRAVLAQLEAENKIMFTDGHVYII